MHIKSGERSSLLFFKQLKQGPLAWERSKKLVNRCQSQIAEEARTLSGTKKPVRISALIKKPGYAGFPAAGSPIPSRRIPRDRCL